MSYASILVHIEGGSPSSEPRLRLAASLARRFNAALMGVAAGAVQMPPVDAFGGAVFIGDIMAEEEKQILAELAAAEEKFRADPATQGLTLDWRSAVDLPTQVLTRESRSADLIVMGNEFDFLRSGVYRSADPGEVIMGAGRPVLVVPPGTETLKAENVVLGWKDSREARRAMWDAGPLLKAAQSVHVVEITSEEESRPATERIDDVVRHLGRHGVKAQGEVRTQRKGSPAEELVLFAEQRDADLIVVGGYGYARLREWIFGGVTRDLLKSSPKCCLFSH